MTTAGTPFRADAETAGRLSTDELGTIQAPQLTTASSTAYNPPSDPGGISGRRWGDYSYVSLDPLDDMSMWMINQFCVGTNLYGCQVTKLIAPPPATPASCSPAFIAAGQASVDVTLTGTSFSGSGFYDPGTNLPAPALAFNHIAATVAGGVIVNSITYTNPTTITLNLNTTAAALGSQSIAVANPDGQSMTSTGDVLTITAALCDTSTLPTIMVLQGTICTGTPDTLVIISGFLNDGTHWQWYTGSCGGTPATVQNTLGDTLFVSPSITTSYYVRGEGNCVSGAPCASATITVNQISADPISAAAAPTTICNGESSTLTLNGGGIGTGEAIKWYTASCGGTLAGMDNSLSVSPTTTTTYFGRYENGAPCNYNSMCAQVTVTVNQVTGGTVAGDQMICSGGDPAAFTEILASTGSALTYQWQGSTTDCSSGFTNINGEMGTTYDVPSGVMVTTYYRRMTTSTLNSVVCTANSNCVTVMPIIDNVDPTAICQNQQAQLVNSNASITAAQINNGSSDNCGIASLSLDRSEFNCADAGDVTITLTVTDLTGNSSTCNATVTILRSSLCPFPPCTPIIDIEAAFLANDPHQNDFHAGMNLIADGIITSTNMEAISFKAGNEVELRPVFEVQVGSLLTINTEDCIPPNAVSKKVQSQ
jgi:hypothetical protein